MTKKLAETFGIEIDDSDYIETEDTSDIEIIKPDDDLLEESGVSDHEQEMNKIFELAIEAHTNTMELGFGVEPKNSGSGLSASATYLSIALNASKSKVDKKLALIKIKNEKSTKEEQVPEEQEETGNITSSRGQLMKELKSIMDEYKKTK